MSVFQLPLRIDQDLRGGFFVPERWPKVYRMSLHPTQERRLARSLYSTI